MLGARTVDGSCFTSSVARALDASNAACAGAVTSVPSSEPTRGASLIVTTPSVEIDDHPLAGVGDPQMSAVHRDAGGTHVDREGFASRHGHDLRLDGPLLQREDDSRADVRDGETRPPLDDERELARPVDGRRPASRFHQVTEVKRQAGRRRLAVDEYLAAHAHDRTGQVRGREAGRIEGERVVRVAERNGGDRNRRGDAEGQCHEPGPPSENKTDPLGASRFLDAIEDAAFDGAPIETLRLERPEIVARLANGAIEPRLHSSPSVPDALEKESCIPASEGSSTRSSSSSRRA